MQNVSKMGKCWWKEILPQPSSNTTTTHNTHHCIYYTQEYKMRLENCLQRERSLHFTVCLVTSTSTDGNRTLMWWCILPNHTCNLESLGKISRLPSVSHHKWIFKTRFTLQHTFYTSLFKLFRKVWNITARILSLTSSMSLYIPTSYDPHILDVNNKCSLAGELSMKLWGKGLSLDILVP
jgi:hypothetical protein